MKRKKLKSLECRRADLRRELTRNQLIIADGTERKLDGSSLDRAREILEDLTGLSEEDFLEEVSKMLPRPLSLLQKVKRALCKLWSLLKAVWAVIFGIALFGAAVATLLGYFKIFLM